MFDNSTLVEPAIHKGMFQLDLFPCFEVLLGDIKTGQKSVETNHVGENNCR